MQDQRTECTHNKKRNLIAFLKHKRYVCLFYGKMHYHSADHFASRNKWFYAASIFFTLIALYLSNSKVAEAAIAKFSEIFAFYYFGISISGAVPSQLFVGFIGFIAVVIFCWQLFARYEERQAIHRLFSADYFNIARKIERIIASDCFDDRTVHEIARTINVTSKHAPTISSAFWDYEEELQKYMEKASQFINDENIQQ